MKTFIKDMTKEQLQKVITGDKNLPNELFELLRKSFIDLYRENYENYYIENNDYTKIYVMIEKTI